MVSAKWNKGTYRNPYNLVTPILSSNVFYPYTETTQLGSLGPGRGEVK